MTRVYSAALAKWVVLGFLVAGGIVSGLSLVAVPRAPEGTFLAQPAAPAGMILADLSTGEENEALQAELSLKDPTPLFLPTAQNSGQVNALSAVDQAPGSSFDGFGAKLWYPVAANDLDLPDAVEVPADPLVAVDGLGEPLALGELSRVETVARALPPRQALLQVLSVTSGEVLHEVVLQGPAEAGPLNAPLEAVMTVNSTGLQLRPTVIESPVGATVELDQVDLWLKESRLESILRPGFYRILLGP